MNIKRIKTTAALLAVLLLTGALPSIAPARQPKALTRIDPAICARLDRLLGPSDGVLLAGPDGKILYEKNADAALTPASVLKIVTALFALRRLGADFRFATDFLVDEHRNLYVRGNGDPLLTSEEIEMAAGELARRISAVGDVVADGSGFAPVRIPGVSRTLNPYDAPSGALCVNFNTVQFRREGNEIFSAEPQTPLTPLASRTARNSGLRQGRIVLPAESGAPLQYAAELFAAFLRRAGVSVAGAARPGLAPPAAQLLLRRHSPVPLDEVVRKALKYSNNYMANQLFITAGCLNSPGPASLENSLVAAGEFLSGELKISGIRMAEGSGISRKNRVSARSLAAILREFAPHCALLQRKGAEFYKTGHLKGVRTRAGYIDAPGGLYPFVVLRNASGKDTEPVMIHLKKLAGI